MDHKKIVYTSGKCFFLKKSKNGPRKNSIHFSDHFFKHVLYKIPISSDFTHIFCSKDILSYLIFSNKSATKSYFKGLTALRGHVIFQSLHPYMLLQEFPSFTRPVKLFATRKKILQPIKHLRPV